MNTEKQIQQLNNLVADAFILYVKLHNFHWNVRGINFLRFHELTEGYYNYFATLYDDLAERILQLGSKPLSTTQQYLDNAEIKDDTRTSFTSEQIVQSILTDFQQLHSRFMTLKNTSAEANDPATEGMADQTIAWLEKAIWMLKYHQTS